MGQFFYSLFVHFNKKETKLEKNHSYSSKNLNNFHMNLLNIIKPDLYIFFNMLHYESKIVHQATRKASIFVT